MSADIAGFIGALVLAAIVLIWIIYCMFVREHHKSEYHQFDISDLRHRNYQLAEEQKMQEAAAAEKKVTTGIFILPSRPRRKDESYEKRPDYPESPAPTMQAGNDKLIEMFNESVADADIHYKDGIYEIDSNSQYHSDV